MARNSNNNLIGKGKLGVETKSLDVLNQGVMQQVEMIVNDASHPLHYSHVHPRSGRLI